MDQFVEEYIHHPRMEILLDWIKSEGRENSEYFYFKQVRNKKHCFFAIKIVRLNHFIKRYLQWKLQNKPLHIHEIIADKSKCKMYIDVEQKNVLEINEKLLPIFIKDLTKFVQSERYMVFNGSRMVGNQRPFEYKWSYHIVMTDIEYDDNYEAMPFIVTKFFQKFTQYDHFKDLGVYSRNRPMRMLWSSKDDGHPLEFDYNLSSKVYESYTKERILRNSLITTVPMYEKPVTKSGKIRPLKKQKLEEPEVDLGKHCDDIIKKFLSEHNGTIRKCYSTHENFLKIETSCKYCLTKKEREADAYHKNNNIYLMVQYFESGEYEIRQGCYDPECHLHAKKNFNKSLPLIFASYSNNGDSNE